MKVLITGHKGFIGKAFQLDTENDFEQVLYDIADSDMSLKEVLLSTRPDAVFHFGACSDTMNTNIDTFMKDNVQSTFFLADWCSLHQVPLIYSSSASVYGHGNGSPFSFYSMSKYVTDKYVVKSGGISLRYFNVYGYDESHKGKMASFAFQSIIKFRNAEQVSIFPIQPTRDFIYIKDVIEANLHALRNYKKLKGNFYDVGTGKSRTFEEMLDFLNIPYDYLPSHMIPKHYQFYTKADLGKKMGGWKANWSLELGLEDYINTLNINYFS